MLKSVPDFLIVLLETA